ncbi:MAG: alpha/beta fold hydrolase [Francisellaceae bacterium]
MDAGVDIDLLLENVFPWIYADGFLKNKAKISAELLRIKNDPTPQLQVGYEGQVAAIYKFDSTSQLSSIRTRTLVIAADQDILIPVNVCKIIADNIQDSAFRLLPDCGHMFHREQPELFAQMILDFIHVTPKYNRSHF